MPKAKIAYLCTECGAHCVKWAGQCPDCGSWNTIRIDGDLVSVAMQKWYDGIGKPGSKKVWGQDRTSRIN